MTFSYEENAEYDKINAMWNGFIIVEGIRVYGTSDYYRWKRLRKK